MENWSIIQENTQNYTKYNHDYEPNLSSTWYQEANTAINTETDPCRSGKWGNIFWFHGVPGTNADFTYDGAASLQSLPISISGTLRLLPTILPDVRMQLYCSLRGLEDPTVVETQVNTFIFWPELQLS